MAEAPTVPAPVTDSPAPITSLADLDTRMAEIRANPSPEQGDQPPEQGQSTAPKSTPERPAESEQEDVPEPGEEEPSADTAPKPGGRFARLREQLTTAEQKAREYESALTQRQQTEQMALRQFVNLVLPDAELEALRIRAEGGDWEAKQRVDLARQWRQMAAPIADLAHQAVNQQFNAALADLRTLDGMDGDTHKKLLDAASPGDKLKLAWQSAFKAAEQASKERIDALEAEVRTLKTNKAANGAQPAAGGGRGNSSALAGWLGPDGLPTEEAIQRARMGAFRDLGTSS
jgi:hypothetical protein